MGEDDNPSGGQRQMCEGAFLAGKDVQRVVNRKWGGHAYGIAYGRP